MAIKKKRILYLGWFLGIILSVYICFRGYSAVFDRVETKKSFSYTIQYLGSQKGDYGHRYYFYKIDGQVGTYKTDDEPTFYGDLTKPEPVKFDQISKSPWYGKFWGIESNLKKVKYVSRDTPTISLPEKDSHKNYIPLYRDRNDNENRFSAFLAKFGDGTDQNCDYSFITKAIPAIVLICSSNFFLVYSLIRILKPRDSDKT